MHPALLSVLSRITAGDVILFIWFLVSMAVALARHPKDRLGALAQVLRLLGRLSLLRHVDAPGTLHVPGVRQPLPLTTLQPPADESDDSRAIRRITTGPVRAGQPVRHSGDGKVSPIGCALAFCGVGLLGGCFTPARLQAQLERLDVLQAAADVRYGSCLKDAGIVKPPTRGADVPAACQATRTCLVLSAWVGKRGAEAMAEAAAGDPWLRGPAARDFVTAYPSAVTACDPPAPAPAVAK